MTKTKDHPKVFMPPLLLFFALIAIAFFLEHKFPFGFPKAPLRFRLPAALILAIHSGYISIHSLIVLKKNGNTINSRKPIQTLVDEGPFKFSRNPMYLSLLIGFLSLAVWFYSMWFYFFTSLLWLILDCAAVGPEEAYLQNKFGDTYKEYKSKVPRWI